MSGDKIKLQKTKPQKNRLGKIDLSGPIESAEEIISKQNEFLNIILNSLNHPFLVIDANNYTVKKFNRATSSGDLPSETTCYQLRYGRSTPCRGESLICPVREIKKTKKPIVVEHILTNKKGKQKIFEVHGFPILNEIGDVAEIIEYYLDITERRRTEEQLQRKRDFAENLVDTAQAIILILDKNGRIVRFNSFMEKISGYSLAEVRGKDWFSTFLPPQDYSEIRTLFQKAVGDIQTKGNVNSIVTKDGSERQIEWYDKTLKGTDGNVIGLLAIGIDITERKQAEEELKEKNHLTQIILDSLPFPAMLIREDRSVVATNKFARNVGAKVGGFCWRDFGQSDYIPEKDKEYINQHKCVPEGGTQCTFCLADNTFTSDESQNSPEIQAFGRIWDTYWIPVDDKTFLHFAIDTTDRKKAEEELKQAHDLLEVRVRERTAELANINEFLNNVFKSLSHPFYVIDANDYTVKMSNFAADLDAISKGIKCYKLTHGRSSPCNGKDHFCPLEKVRKIKKPFTVEHDHCNDDGDRRILEMHIHPILDSDGNVVQIIEYCIDITARKQAEETLTASEARFKELWESLREGVGIVDENEIIQFCNPAYAKILDADSPDNLIGKSLIDFIPENQRKLILDQTARRKKNTSSRYEVEIITEKNRRKFISISASPRYTDDGNYIGAFGCIMDITERRQMEDTLSDSNEQLMFKHKALEEKNIALKEVLSQIGDDKKNMASRIHSNIDRIVTPILRRLNDKVGPAEKNDIILLQSSLELVTTPFVSKLEALYGRLTPREVEICNMIKGGLSSKEIASLLNTSWETVRNQRKHIRNKLGITGEKISLTSFLRTT